MKDWIKTYPARGIMTELSRAAGCDRTYFSQCLNSKVQLTADHAIALSEVLNLNDLEKDYFLHLVLFERSASEKVRQQLRQKLDTIAKELTNLSKSLSVKKSSVDLSEEDKSIYYSDWRYPYIHIMTSISKFKNLKSIANHLATNEKIIEEMINKLINMGLVIRQGTQLSHSGKNIHIDKGTSNNKANHTQWRLKALDSCNENSGIHYSTLFAVSEEDVKSLQTQLLGFLEKQRHLVTSSGSEKLLCFCCDLFSPVNTN